MICAVYGCTNSAESVNGFNNIQFFTFPEQESMKKVWLSAILWKVPDPPRGSVVCSDHFDDRFFVKSTNKIKRLKKHSVPRILRKVQQEDNTQFVISQVTSTSALPIEEFVDLTDMEDDYMPSSVIVSTSAEQNKMETVPQNNDIIVQVQMPFTMSSTEEIHLSQVISDAVEFNEPTPHIVVKSTVHKQNATKKLPPAEVSQQKNVMRSSPPNLILFTPPKTLNTYSTSNNKNTYNLNNTLNNNNTNNTNTVNLQNNTNNINNISQNTYRGNLKMLNSTASQLLSNTELYLGIDSASSDHIIEVLRTDNPPLNGSLPNKDVILFTLAKLKQNNSIENWSNIFNVTKDTMLGLFGQMCGLLSNKMSCFVHWPSSDQIRLNLPICYKNNYLVCESLIDIFEIRIEEPYTELHKQLTWSENIQSHSIKYLISCTPDGLINFVSEGFVGDTSIRDIVRNSGYLKGLRPKVGVLATKKFRTIEKDVQNQNSIFFRPASILAKKILTEREEKLNKQKSQLLNPITQLIKRLNQFEILRSVVDEDLQYYLDDIMIIICALLNLQQHIDFDNVKL